MRLGSSAHTSQPWLIHELTPDFRLEDVWALPAQGGAGDFERLVKGFAAGDLAASRSLPTRTLVSLRHLIGQLLGWDRAEEGLGSRVPTLRDRLPTELVQRSATDSNAGPFRTLYMLENEWAAEIANKTVHGVLHLGWVGDGAGGYRGQMAILVKPNGLIGEAYMAAIKPFRHLIVYPALLRQVERAWLSDARS